MFPMIRGTFLLASIWNKKGFVQFPYLQEKVFAREEKANRNAVHINKNALSCYQWNKKMKELTVRLL